MAGKKKKNNGFKDGAPIQVVAHVMNDTTHRLMETTLLNIEEIEMKMLDTQESEGMVPEDMFMIHDLLLGDMDVLLSYRLHSDN